jgi:hypothetical protein
MIFVPDSIEQEAENACNRERIKTLEEIKIMLNKLRFYTVEDYKDAVYRIDEKINETKKLLKR